MASNYGIVSAISAPVLSSLKQQSVIQFETEYSACLNQINDINRSRTFANRITPASVRQCLAPTFLNSLCIIGRIDGASSSDEATDASVKKWFQERLDAVPKDLAERVRS